ncbi:MAG TPA: TIGR02996 domain-containing protein [Gemmata sp.]
MNDEAGFLKALADQPAERATRLAFADWLDEQGRASEAEFLKLQLQIEERNKQLIELGGECDVNWLAAISTPAPEQMTLTLISGRAIEITGLNQRPVYGHFTLGAPRVADNDRKVDEIVRTEQNRTGRAVHLIRPRQRPIAGDSNRPEHKRALLPGIVCVATFTSFEPARDENLVYSELDIIWFQNFPALPLDPGVREQIRAIDWNQHAHDFDW